jgi:alpha-L-fucosidase 2
MGYCAPGFGAEWGMYPAGAAWHCHFVWKKFAYSRDRGYLEQTGYPILKEAATFWLQNLVEYQGWLITAPSGSAEHGAFLVDGKLQASGSSYGADVINIPGNFQDIEMIRELFSNTIEAATLLKTDEAFADKMKTARDRLMPFKTGQYGQLQEWAEDIDTADCNHRHIAHLYAVWPAKQISPLAGAASLTNPADPANPAAAPANPANPALVSAAKKALELRGEARNYKNLPHKDIFTAANWSLGLRMACWIRLQDAERANKIFTTLITEAGFENLLTFQQTPVQFTASLKGQEDVYYFTTPEGSWTPVWQIDASLAIPGFITEMLLQSYGDHLFLLPALPEEWPEGQVKGIRAEGNLSVDIEWKKRKVTKYKVSSPTPGKIHVHVNGEIIALHPESAPAESVSAEPMPAESAPV